MEMENTYSEVMTTTEAMRYLKISRKTLLKLVRNGEIPAKKVGKDYRYLRSEIDRYLRGASEVNYFNG